MSSTRAGTLKGKLAYMSPEQVHGEGIDRRTDIFALAVVLWELTTGQRLFRMESDLDTLAKVQECNVPRPSSIVRGYPIDLEKIVMKALSKNRGERFKSAREFSRALQSLLMRRGLFIASDEVCAYMKQIFDDRIKKREAHLRWAAEVTQTINIEGILTRPQPPIGSESSLESYSSEVQPAPTARHVAVRPAAGAPPERPPTLTGPTNPQRLPQTPTVRPPARQPKPEPHPADDGPTLQASPQARAQMMETALGAAALPPPLDDDDGDDNDDTIVTTTRIESHAHPASMPTPPPAAGKPATYPPPATVRGVAPPRFRRARTLRSQRRRGVFRRALPRRNRSRQWSSRRHRRRRPRTWRTARRPTLTPSWRKRSPSSAGSRRPPRHRSRTSLTTRSGCRRARVPTTPPHPVSSRRRCRWTCARTRRDR